MSSLNRIGRTGPLLAMLVPVAGTSEHAAVTDTSAELATELSMTELYTYTADVDSFVAQGATPTAAAADGCTLIPAGMPLLIDGAQGARLAVVRAGSADGVATLQTMAVVS